MQKLIYSLVFSLVFTSFSFAQISGKVVDNKSNETIIGANILLLGTTVGVSTDFNGLFTIEASKITYPAKLEVSFIGYKKIIVDVSASTSDLIIKLKEDQTMLDEVDIVEQRLSEKQRTSALTVEALDGLAIKETPAVNFYEALGNLKGVDLTSASIGFKVVNTRGFNSTSPVRSLQVIDGVDNQAPGLNFSLGNFLGASELDIQSVDIIAGASSAFYGPGAFNGVVAMTTKNPFDYQGVSASVKVGERAMTEVAFRYAEAFKVGGKDYENLAFKLNLFYLRANDWEADNYDPIFESEAAADNPGRFDAINIYGDEDVAGGNDFTDPISVIADGKAGLGKFYRSGYQEPDLVDYNTRNIKTNLGVHYKFTKDLELSYNFNYGTGTTVYQGENRFSLKNINFFQNVLELKKENKFFIRAYATNEDAGDSYDAVLAALRMNEAVASNANWNNRYSSFWNRNGYRYGDSTLMLTGRPSDFPNLTPEQWLAGPYQDSLAKYNDVISQWHDNILGVIDNSVFPRPEAGTESYDSLLNLITGKTFTEGGAKFYDRSALYHIMGEYQFHPEWADIRVGGNFRQYRPDSRGNIFDEIRYTQTTDSLGNITTDTSFVKIVNSEWGIYGGIERTVYDDRLKMNFTIRLDKNQNFDYNISPALSLIYLADKNNTLRVSFSSAIRNPTLQDQYLNYNIGRAILLGNINGIDSLVSIDSFDEYREDLDKSELDYFSVPPIQPERVQTLEFGYRTTLFKKLFLDMNYYHNWYTNFIGFQFGLDVRFPNSNPVGPFSSVQAFRVAANSTSLVTSQGFNIGANYFLNDKLSLNGNYSWNRLDLKNTDDPIVPAFNTPEHKFNVGFTGRGYKPFSSKDHKLGYSVNYKWIEGFIFEGSPQFTGFIENYGLLDAQVSYSFPKQYTTLKLGASNLLNNKVSQVYGGPRVGRLAYFSIVFEKF